VKLWIVIMPSGEQHILDKEPIGGIEEWAKGLSVTILEFRFTRFVKRAAGEGPAK